MGEHHLVKIITGHCHLLKAGIERAKTAVAVMVYELIFDVNAEVLLDFELAVVERNVKCFAGVFFGIEICDIVTGKVGLENNEILAVVFLFDAGIFVIGVDCGGVGI